MPTTNSFEFIKCFPSIGTKMVINEISLISEHLLKVFQ